MFDRRDQARLDLMLRAAERCGETGQCVDEVADDWRVEHSATADGLAKTERRTVPSLRKAGGNLEIHVDWRVHSQQFSAPVETRQKGSHRLRRVSDYAACSSVGIHGRAPCGRT